MENVPTGSDGRRLFSPAFKREQVASLLRGEVTISELSRALGISRSVLQAWKHLIAHARIRELERLIGKQAVDVEILRAARDEVAPRANRRRNHRKDVETRVDVYPFSSLFSSHVGLESLHALLRPRREI